MAERWWLLDRLDSANRAKEKDVSTKADCLNGEHTIDNQGICHHCGMSPSDAKKVVRIRRKAVESERELSRERFEDWLRTETTVTHWRPNTEGDYDNYEASLAWRAWQAALGFTRQTEASR